MSAPKDRPVVVTKIVDECPSVRTFRLELPEGEPFDFRPGQFVMVAFPEEPKLRRAYSIASSPLEKGYVEITLGKVGEFTGRMFGLKGGETLLLGGPYGRWTYDDGIRNAVFISGGTGVTPFRSMIRYALGKGLPNRLTLLYSARTPSNIIYGEELKDFARRGVRVHVTITRPQELGRHETWSGATGRIDIETLRAQTPVLSQAHYFLCGPNKLVDSLKEALARAGVPAAQVLYEKWGEY